MTLERHHPVHPGTVWVWREPDDRFPELTCSFCGSLTPEAAERFLGSDSPTASGSDWKYGWPHKFYITDSNGQMWKFYSEHLTEAENFDALTELIRRWLEISFWYDEVGRMRFSAPVRGHQTWVLKGVSRGERELI